jgi:glycosyltransferase involved in cell wall biosynthesis
MIKRTYFDGVSVLLHTLNNEDDIEEALQTISQNSPNQIIVVDGGSIDATVKLAKRFTNDVYVTPQGFGNQQKEGLRHVKYNFLFIMESDHRYPKDFILNLKNELVSSEFYGIQGTLKCIQQSNFFERGISIFYDTHQLYKGLKEVIGGPSIYYSDIYVDKICLDGFNGYSMDTRKGEIEKKLGLKVGLGSTMAFQQQKLNAKIFFRKYFNYGRGDYNFFSFHKNEWTLSRKIKSLFHVFNRYIVVYPIRSIFIGKPQGIPYFWLSAFVRYYGWIYEFVKSR